MGRRRYYCLILTLSCCSLMGCRNPNRNLSSNLFNPLWGSTRVASPGTYQVQIPGRAGAEGSGVRAANNIPPAGSANRSVANPATNHINTQNGWQPLGSGGTAPSNNSTISNPSATNTSARSNIAGGGVRVAQNTTGLSYTDRANFRTTAVDERLDRSRLPVTDASGVRAPTSPATNSTTGQLAPYYVPNRNAPNQIQNLYNNGQPSASVNRGSVGTVVGSFAQPGFDRFSQPYSGQRNQILAQSSVYADPSSDPALRSAWTNRQSPSNNRLLSR